jgi:sugar phosphate isomerase/epimerase
MWTAETWPIAPSLQQFSGTLRDGVSATYAGPEHWSDVAYEVKAAGFSHFDVFDTWVRVGDMTPQMLHAFQACIDHAGLTLSAISCSRRSPIDPVPEVASDNLHYLHRVIDSAAELGVSTITMGLHEPLSARQEKAIWFWLEPSAKNPADRDTWELAVRRFRELGRHAARAGVSLSLEIYEDTYLGTSESAYRLISDIGLANVGINPDLGNIVRLHRPIEDWRSAFETLLPISNYWHLKNYSRDFDPATGAYFTAPSTLAVGYIDYRWAIQAALSSGYDSPLCVEQYGGDTLSVAAENQAYVRRIISTWEGKQRIRETNAVVQAEH